MLKCAICQSPYNRPAQKYPRDGLQRPDASIDQDHRMLAGPYMHHDEGEREAGVLPALHRGGDENSRHPNEELDCLVTS